MSEPASLLQILRSEPRRTQQSGAAHRGRGLSDPASATALFARGRGVRHLSTDLLRYSEATQLVAHLDPRGPGTRDRGRCSESSEARLDAEPLYKDQRERDQDADDGEFDGQRHGK